MKKNLLIIDDDPLVLSSLNSCFTERGIEISSVLNPEEGVALVRGNPDKFSVIILDYKFPGTNGADVAKRIKRFSPHIVILMYSGDDSRESMTSSFKAGVSDFIEKGSNPEELITEVESAFKRREELSVIVSHENQKQKYDPISSIGLIGVSEELKAVAKKVIDYKKSSYTVIIIGDSGTGKEKIARALHKGMRGGFFPVNCAGYKDNVQLMESELFGYEKGAFTGAEKTTTGIFESAHDGVVFLDEIHQLCVNAQVKLLRVLQQKAIRRVGGKAEIPVNCRVVAAAKPIIEKMRDRGEFLIDLYNRLYVFPIEIPSLKKRIADLEPLVLHFCEKYSNEIGKKKSILATTLELMKHYHWPGNVRELEHTVLRLVVNSKSNLITPEDFEKETMGVISEEENILCTENLNLRTQVEIFEKSKIFESLTKSRYNKVKAAKLLGIPESTLRLKMKKYGFYEEENTV